MNNPSLEIFVQNTHMICNVHNAGFFLTPAAEKTKKLKLKTQGKKLKEKTQPQGGHLPPFKRNSRKKLNFTYVSLDTEKISWCTTFYAIFVYKYFQILPIWDISYKKILLLLKFWQQIK